MAVILMAHLIWVEWDIKKSLRSEVRRRKDRNDTQNPASVMERGFFIYYVYLKGYSHSGKTTIATAGIITYFRLRIPYKGNYRHHPLSCRTC